MCTCGNIDQHIIMRRFTADGYEVCLWENGAITGSMGIGLPGVPLARPKTPTAEARSMALGLLMHGDLELYDASELPVLHATAKRASLKDGLPGTMRRMFAETQERAQTFTVPLRWHISRTDSRGVTTERWTTLPRLRWSGLTVFDFCGSEGSARGRYRIFRLVASHGSDHTVTDTGLAFRTLRDLFAHLETYNLGDGSLR